MQINGQCNERAKYSREWLPWKLKQDSGTCVISLKAADNVLRAPAACIFRQEVGAVWYFLTVHVQPGDIFSSGVGGAESVFVAAINCALCLLGLNEMGAV